MKDQWDYVLNVLEKLGDKQLFLKYQWSTDISFSILLLLPSKLSHDHPTNKAFAELILKKILDLPELNCSIVFSLYVRECRRRLITFFETSYAEKEDSPGSRSIHFLSFIGIVLGTSTVSLLWGFAFALDLAAITFTLECDACSSSRSAGTSVLL